MSEKYAYERNEQKTQTKKHPHVRNEQKTQIPIRNERKTHTRAN